MKRDLVALTGRIFDVLVVGGGIHGAWVAWDAALRGLSVALIDKGDFGHATSANSLKTVHGGLRYLQDGDLGLVRTMIRERMTLMHVAPHLVHPLPCLMPTYPTLTKSRWTLAVALAVNDLLCADHKLPDPQKRLPKGRILSREECLCILPGVADAGITGGALWHDAQIYNSERLTLSVIRSAVEQNAVAANYVEAIRFLGSREHVTGVCATDRVSGHEFDVRAHLVINAAGAWINRLLGLIERQQRATKVQLSVAMNIVTRQLVANYAAGVSSWPHMSDQSSGGNKRSRLLFIAPWRNRSIVGTTHMRYEGSPDEYQVSVQAVDEFLEEINSAYPDAALTLNDVLHVHYGFLPIKDGWHETVKLLRRGQVWNHAAEDGVDGLISVVGVKYTSARHVAQQAIDLAIQKLGATSPTCRTHYMPIYGGQIHRFDDFLTQAVKQKPKGVSIETIHRLVYNYGTNYANVLTHRHEASAERTMEPDMSIVQAEVRHAVREEMAQTLSDVVLRRTELGSAGWPGDGCVRICADVMASELGWGPGRIQQEIAELKRGLVWINEACHFQGDQ